MQPRARYVVPLPNGRTLNLGERTLVMGIVNVTPDSFADGGVRLDPARAVDDALQMVADGADLLDIGAESTRPGASPLPIDEELDRLLPVLEGLREKVDVALSVDTYKAVVAAAALDRGAELINDVSALRFDPGLARVVAERGAALVLMHSRGRSADMYALARYDDVAGDVARELEQRLAAALGAGIPRERILLDPGIGFAKRAEHSYAVLAGLGRLAVLGRPLLVGPSRKSFVAEPLGGAPPDRREWGTAAAVAASVLAGAHVVRVHGVREMVDVVRVADRLRAAWEAELERPPGPN
jgi:dihydropteroate synthase